MVLPLKVGKERAGGRERKLAWLLYAVLVLGFVLYGVFLIQIALSKRASGDVATSIRIVEEQFQFPNILLCPQWFDFPQRTTILTDPIATDECTGCEKQMDRQQHSGFTVLPNPPWWDTDSDNIDTLNVSLAWVVEPDHGQDGYCYRIHCDDWKATMNGQLRTFLVLHDLNIDPHDFKHLIFTAYTELSSGELARGPIQLITFNEGNELRISKHVRRKWNGNEEITYPIKVTPPWQVVGMNLYYAIFAESKSDDELGRMPSEPEDPYIYLIVTAESETYELLHEIDPLNAMAIIGQLGGVFSFIAVIFRWIFVPLIPENVALRARENIARCLQPEASGDDIAPAEAAAGAKQEVQLRV